MAKLSELELQALKLAGSKTRRRSVIKSKPRGKLGLLQQKELLEKLESGQLIWMGTPYIESAKFRFKEVTGKRLYFYPSQNDLHQNGRLAALAHGHNWHGHARAGRWSDVPSAW